MRKLSLIFFTLISFGLQAQLTWTDEYSGPGGGSPRMAQMSDGTLLLGVDAGAIRLYKSTNGADTWAELTDNGVAAIPNPDPTPNDGINHNERIGNVLPLELTNGDIIIAYRHLNDNAKYDVIDGNGTDDGIEFYNIDIQRSTDGGKTWTYSSSVINHPDSPNGGVTADDNTGVWEPFLYQHSPTELWCMYARQNCGRDCHPLFTNMKRSYDNGLTWSDEEIIAGPSNLGHPEATAGMANVVKADNGDLLCIFENFIPAGNDDWFRIGLVRSTDNGNTWGNLEIVYDDPITGDYGAGAPYIVKLADGKLVVSYQRGPKEGQQFGYVTSIDNGITWTDNFDLFDVHSEFNGLFVDSDNTLYGLTSGVRYKKHFPSGTEPSYNGEAFYLVSVESDKILGLVDENYNNGSNVNLYSKDNLSNKQWVLHNENDGFFSLQPSGSTSKRLSVDPSGDQGSNLHIWDVQLGDNQLWYVIEESGYYKIVNKASGNVIDIFANETADATKVVLWESLGENNQRFSSLMVNGSQLNPFKGVTKKPTYRIRGKQSSRLIDVSGPSDANGTNIHLWDDLNAPNQKWSFNRVDTDYFWLEPAHAQGSCLNVDYDFVTNGNNIHLWKYGFAGNTQWKVKKEIDGFFIFENKGSGKCFETSSSGVNNGTNIQQWDFTGNDNQKWSIESSEIYYPKDPSLAYIYPDRISLNPGKIGNSQEIDENDNPEGFTSDKIAIGNGSITYKWQYTFTPNDESSWIDIDNTNSETYTSPNLKGLSSVDFEIFSRRKATDLYYTMYSNIVSLKVTVNSLSEVDNNSSLFMVYPNPAIDNLIIETDGISVVEIYNINGVKVYNNRIDKRTVVDIREYHSGMYIVKISSENFSSTKQFIKE